jgi:hypothetical protein
MIKSTSRGHEIYFKNDKWYYSDNDELTRINGKVRSCKKCGKGPDEGPDPCLGNLSGISNACCGHGDREKSYIRFTNGIVLKGFTIEKY